MVCATPGNVASKMVLHKSKFNYNIMHICNTDHVKDLCIFSPPRVCMYSEFSYNLYLHSSWLTSGPAICMSQYHTAKPLNSGVEVQLAAP
jgi:hypothetical protein